MKGLLFALGLGAILTLGLAAPAPAQLVPPTGGSNRGLVSFVSTRSPGHGLPYARGYRYGYRGVPRYGYGYRYPAYRGRYGYSSGYRGVPRYGYGYGLRYPAYRGWWGYPGFRYGYGPGYGYQRRWVNPYWRYGSVYGLGFGSFLPW